MKHWHEKGFTLIELMITLLVAAVILGVGVPNFQEFIANNRMAAATNDVISALHMARSEAIKRRTNVTLCPSANWDADNPACNNGGVIGGGYIIFVDCSAAAPNCGAPNLSVDAFDVVLSARGPLPDAIAAAFTTDAAGAQYLSFAATGFPRNAPGFAAAISNIQLCDHRGNHHTGGGVAAGRWIQIGPTGRPQIYREQNDVQGGNNPLNGC